MRVLTITMVLLLVGCGTFHDIITPDVPLNIAEEQLAANEIAFQLLNNLDNWIEDPDLIPSDAAIAVRAQIVYLQAHLNVVRLWMLSDSVEGGVTQTVVDLLTAWEDYIDNHFCKGETAWLVTKAVMSADDMHAWHQVFKKLNKLHRQVYTWMEHKGIQDA